MKFTTLRTDKGHRLRVQTRSAEWFLARIKKDTSQGLIAGYRHYLKYASRPGSYSHMDEIPHLCVACELQRGESGTPDFVAWNGLVAIEVAELDNALACQRVKQSAMRQPSTWAAMTGADGRSVLVLVCVAPTTGPAPCTEVEAETLHRAAYYALLPVYDALLGCTVQRREPHLTDTVLLPFDPEPLVNTKAMPFLVDAPVAPGADATDTHPLARPESAHRYTEPAWDTYQMHARFYRRAANLVMQQLEQADLDDAEWWAQYVRGVAYELYACDLAEGETVCLIWNNVRYRDVAGLTEEFVRDITAAIYQTAGGGRRRNPEPPITNMMGTLIRRIDTYYVLRRNTTMGYAEYRPNNSWVVPWRPVTDEVVNTFTTDLQLSGLDVWERDVRRYINSTRVPAYDPVEEYLLGVSGKWDGTDHIGALARTVPTDIGKQWEAWFHTWFLGMVHQWRNRRTQFGNSVVPLLISAQGMHKSTFCRNLLPPELRAWGYTDNLSLAEERAVHQAMAQMLLINLDEFNRISPKKQEGFLKNIIQLPTVKVKRPYGRYIEEVPRLASFIATTNMADVLTDPSGSRRFIGVRVKGAIDVSHKLNYEQLYAQALAELDLHVRHWFDDEQTAAIMEHNRQFEQLPAALQFFLSYFEPGTGDDGKWLTAAELLALVKERAGGALRDMPTLNAFGRFLGSTEGMQEKRTKVGHVYLVRQREIEE